jgi:hypothetical protein
MSRDYQRSYCYSWEDRYIHAKDTSVIPFEQAQSIVDYVWVRASLTHPPKIRPIAKTAKRINASATRTWIKIPKAGIKTTILLHEIAHSMTTDAMGEQKHGHGSRFVGVFMTLLCAHIPTFNMTELMDTAKLDGIDFNLDGPAL